MVVLALAGMLFTANARLARTSATGYHDDVTQLLHSQLEEATTRVDDLEAQVVLERDQVERLVDEGSAEQDTGDPARAADEAVAAGATAVTGPGLVVELDDAPANRAQPGVAPDTLVVHQQDLEAVVNALWAGGAEAMMLQDQRVLSTTAFRCVGNVLSLHGRVYSPPYRVQAIGDPTRLRAALDASEPVQIYREWVDAVGLGWSVAEDEALQLPAGSVELRYAQVPDDVPVMP
ncbi:MAG: DUF881 domain-containing protein [Cellulomonadaceae bacterium]